LPRYNRSFFAGTPERITEAIIEDLEAESGDWVPSQARELPPQDDPSYFCDQPISDAHSESTNQDRLYMDLQRKVVALEEALSQIPVPPAGLGHNHPPESLTVEPLGLQDRAEIDSASAVIKEQPIQPQDGGKSAEAARETLQIKLDKLKSWLMKTARQHG
jgi:hypothetical protein